MGDFIWNDPCNNQVDLVTTSWQPVNHFTNWALPCYNQMQPCNNPVTTTIVCAGCTARCRNLACYNSESISLEIMADTALVLHVQDVTTLCINTLPVGWPPVAQQWIEILKTHTLLSNQTMVERECLVGQERKHGEEKRWQMPASIPPPFCWLLFWWHCSRHSWERSTVRSEQHWIKHKLSGILLLLLLLLPLLLLILIHLLDRHTQKEEYFSCC